MKRRMAQPLVVLPIAVTLVLTLSVVVLSAQFQPIVPDIGFEIEGNTALDHGGDYDWENTEFPPAIHIPDPNSKIATDPTTFKPNSKFDDPAGWSIKPGKVGPGQSELINFLVWSIPPGDLGGGRPNDYWLVLGMERIKVPGFFELDFEYNQVGWDGSSGGLTRTPGDVLVGFELRGKPTSKRAEYKVLLLQYWPGAQPFLCSTTPGPGGEPELVEVGTDPCPPYGDSGWFYRLLADDALSAESGLVQATMNEDPFPAPWPSTDGNGNPRDVIGPYQFAEAAINLTALGVEPDCSSPGTVHAKSRSAPHVHSDLKDLVGPVVLECASARLDGHKFLDIDGDGLWDRADEPPLEGWEIRLSDGSVTHTDLEGYYAFEDLDYGTYTVSEVCPEGEDWVQSAPGFADTCGDEVYTVELDSNNREVNDLDFGNHWPTKIELAVSKDARTSFTRTYLWTLEKTVDNPGPIFLYPGDYAEVEYEVVAGLDNPAFVDSDWEVEGTITIENLGAADVLLASVTDVISPGDIAVPVNCEKSIVPALGSVTCTYGPVRLPDGSDRTNTVTVHDYAEEWTATADVDFAQAAIKEIDEEADVDDSNWGYLGRVRYDETPHVFDYPWKIQATGDVCGLFGAPNTAVLVTNDTNTVLQDDANVQILEVCLTIAYEDLPLTLSNDWDYNDLVVDVPIYLDVSDDGDLLAASFEIRPQDPLTAFTHALNLQPYAEFFVCSGTYTKKVTVNGVTTTETGDYDPGDNFLLIPNTGVPQNLEDLLVELRIDFDVVAPGDCPRDFGNPDPINQYHGEWLFFDPWLTVYPREDLDLDPYEIHVIQPPDEPEPRILTVPVDWTAPGEKVPVWDVYPCVQEGNPPVFKPYWWDDDLCME